MLSIPDYFFLAEHTVMSMLVGISTTFFVIYLGSIKDGTIDSHERKTLSTLQHLMWFVEVFIIIVYTFFLLYTVLAVEYVWKFIIFGTVIFITFLATQHLIKGSIGGVLIVGGWYALYFTYTLDLFLGGFAITIIPISIVVWVAMSCIAYAITTYMYNREKIGI